MGIPAFTPLLHNFTPMFLKFTPILLTFTPSPLIPPDSNASLVVEATSHHENFLLWGLLSALSHAMQEQCTP